MPLWVLPLIFLTQVSLQIWIGLISSAAIIFGYSISWTRGVRRPARFWWLWASLLLLHFVLFVPVLIYFDRWPLIFFLYSSMAEFAFIFPILTRSLINKRV